MVFIYFGPTPDSWALGNDKFSQCKNLPAPLEDAWNRLAEVQPEPSMAGCDIGWLSASPNGDSYAIMTKGGELLSNRPDIVAAARPSSAVEHISFSPDNGWLIRFVDGKVQHSNFPMIADIDPSSGIRQHSRVRSVVFGAANSLVVHTERGVLSDGVSDGVRESLQGFSRATDMKAAGILLGRATALCPWDQSYYFIEEQSVQGDASRYWYNIPTHEIPSRLIESVVANERPRLQSFELPTPEVVAPELGTIQPPPPYEATPPPSPLQMPIEVRNRYERQFTECCGDRSHVTGVEVALILTRAGLSDTDLGSIWESSDLDKDGRFNKDEFVQAMWLTDLCRGRQGRIRSKSDSLYPAGVSTAAGPSNQEGSRSSFNGTTTSCPQMSQTSASPTLHTRPLSYSHPPPQYVPSPPQPSHQASALFPQSDGTICMSKAFICRRCKRGLIPEEAVYHCQACGDSMCFCMDCYGLGASCPHKMPIVKLVPGSDLPSRSTDGCGRCWASIKKGSVMWHCDKCYDPDLCAKCWRKGKYCRHVEKGKVEICIVPKSGSGMSYVGDALEIVGAVFGV